MFNIKKLDSSGKNDDEASTASWGMNSSPLRTFTSLTCFSSAVYTEKTLPIDISMSIGDTFLNKMSYPGYRWADFFSHVFLPLKNEGSSNFYIFRSCPYLLKYVYF